MRTNLSFPFIALIIPLMALLSCGTINQSTSDDKSVDSSEVNEVNIEKSSIFEKLQANNHLPIEERIALYYQLKKDHFSEYDFANECVTGKAGKPETTTKSLTTSGQF